jgi:hypothetical protein
MLINGPLRDWIRAVSFRSRNERRIPVQNAMSGFTQNIPVMTLRSPVPPFFGGLRS